MTLKAKPSLTILQPEHLICPSKKVVDYFHSYYHDDANNVKIFAKFL